MSEILTIPNPVEKQIADLGAQTAVTYGSAVESVDYTVLPGAADRLTLRQRLAETPLGRAAVKAFAAVTFFGATGGAVIAETGTAQASTAPVYTVTNAASGGVYARYAPHVNSTNRTPGFGIYPGDKVELLCGVTDGDAVGPYNNHSWDFVKDLSRNEGNFWASEHYTNSPNAANTLAPGESRCANESSNPLTTSSSSQSASPSTPIYKTACKFNNGAILLNELVSTAKYFSSADEENYQVRTQKLAGETDLPEVVCVDAQLSMPDIKNHRQYVGTVEASAPELDGYSQKCGWNQTLLEIWGDGFYKNIDCTDPTAWHINKWLKGGTNVCAAESSRLDYQIWDALSVVAGPTYDFNGPLGAKDKSRQITCFAIKA